MFHTIKRKLAERKLRKSFSKLNKSINKELGLSEQEEDNKNYMQVSILRGPGGQAIPSFYIPCDESEEENIWSVDT